MSNDFSKNKLAIAKFYAFLEPGTACLMILKHFLIQAKLQRKEESTDSSNTNGRRLVNTLIHVNAL